MLSLLVLIFIFVSATYAHIMEYQLLLLSFCCSSNPTQLFHFIRQCLSTELKLVQSAGPIHPQPLPTNVNEILGLVEVIRNKTKVRQNQLHKYPHFKRFFKLL